MSKNLEQQNRNPGRRGAGSIRLLVLTPHGLSPRGMGALLRRPRRIHYGLFPGLTGAVPAGQVAVAFHGVGEMLAYTAVRHLAHLLQPELIVHLAMARAVGESLREGDIAMVHETAPCWCPPALPQEMIGDTNLLDANARASAGALGGGVVEPDPFVSRDLLSCIRRAPGALGGDVPTVRAGSMADPLHGWFAREFVRTRFAVDVTDHDSHGFLTACSEVATRGAAVRVIGEKEGSESEPIPHGAWETLAGALAHLTA